jgi:hypothetical protein
MYRRPTMGRHRPAPGSRGARRAPHGAAATPLFAQPIRRPPPAARSAAGARLGHRPTPGSSGARRTQRGAAALPFVAKTIRRPPRPAQSAAAAPHRRPTLGKDVIKGAFIHDILCS